MTPNGPNLGEYEGMFPLILQPVLSLAHGRGSLTPPVECCRPLDGIGELDHRVGQLALEFGNEFLADQ